MGCSPPPRPVPGCQAKCNACELWCGPGAKGCDERWSLATLLGAGPQMFMSRGWEHRRPGGKHGGPPLNFEVKLVGLFDTFFYPLHPELKPGRSLLIAHVQMCATRFLNLRSYSWISRVFFCKRKQCKPNGLWAQGTTAAHCLSPLYKYRNTWFWIYVYVYTRCVVYIQYGIANTYLFSILD
jgi:hypothetical protein